MMCTANHGSSSNNWRVVHSVRCWMTLATVQHKQCKRTADPGTVHDNAWSMVSNVHDDMLALHAMNVLSVVGAMFGV